MSYNPNTSAAAATANQALMVLLDRLNELVEQVLCSQSEEDKMRLSRTIAFQLHNAVHSHLTVATYIPLCLLSMAAEVHHAQMGTAQLVQVPDWSRVRNNKDICQGHPLYSKTLSPSPTVTIPAGSSSAPALAGPSSVPAPAGPSSVPAPAGPSSLPEPAGPSPPAPAGPSSLPEPAGPSPPAPAGPSSLPEPAGPSPPAPAGSTSAPEPVGPSAPAPAGPTSLALAQTSVPPIATLPAPSIVIKIPGGAISGPSKHRKQQFSISPPRPVKRARKIVKSKQILSDTDTDSDGVRIEKGPDEVKGKGKARARSPSSDDNTQEMTMKDATHDPEVKPWPPIQNPLKKYRLSTSWTRPMPPNVRNKGDDPSEYEPEEDVESIGDKKKPCLDRVKDTKLSMSDTRHSGTDKDKKGKRPQPVRHPVITIQCHAWYVIHTMSDIYRD
ncbi:hypothetical protein EV424DRAFT_1535862 [Suillus variegatus]|nr:hypothetical protein EV424DRAFT_1535862 [Suillus variegatus]